MKRVLIAGLLGVSVLLVPGGCVVSVALAGGAIAAATGDPKCLSEESSDPAGCVPD